MFLVLPIKDLINEDVNSTTPHKLSTGKKPSVSHLLVLFFPCVVRKATAYVDTNTLNIHHQAQKGFRGIFVGIPQHQKGYLVHVPSNRKVILSYNVVFDESFSSELSYTSRPYAEAMVMCPTVTYAPYATSSKEKTSDVITFAQFEIGNILTETCHDTESGDESDSESLMMNEQDMKNLNLNEIFDYDLISTETSEDIRDGSQTHRAVNKREARC